MEIWQRLKVHTAFFLSTAVLFWFIARAKASFIHSDEKDPPASSREYPAVLGKKRRIHIPTLTSFFTRNTNFPKNLMTFCSAFFRESYSQLDRKYPRSSKDDIHNFSEKYIFYERNLATSGCSYGVIPRQGDILSLCLV